MNKLFIILTTGAHIPWCMMLLFHVVHYDFFTLLSTLTYILFAWLKWSHLPHGNKSIVFWNRQFTTMEMCFFIRLIVFNITGSPFLSFCTFVGSWWCFFQLTESLQQHVVEAPIYCICILFLMSSTSSILQQIASIVLISISLYLWQTNLTLKKQIKHRKELYAYYISKIVEIYMVFLIEWSSNQMEMKSIITFTFFPFLYSCSAYYYIDWQQEDIREYLYHLHKLPKGYPLPLNFKHAVVNCNIAKKVFKVSPL